MNEEIQKLIEALNVIKNHCGKFSNCKDCELTDALEDCRMMGSILGEWDIDERTTTKVLL